MFSTILTCSRTSDPLVHYGRHFSRTVHALCNINALITNGILRMEERSEEAEESFTAQYVHTLLLRADIIFSFLESGKSIKFTLHCSEWFLGWRNVWCQATQRWYICAQCWWVKNTKPTISSTLIVMKLLYTATEGGLWRKIRWYKKFKVCHCRLAFPTGGASTAFNCSQHQDW